MLAPFPPSDQDDALATELADEAAARFGHLIPAAELEEIRHFLALLLVGTMEGRRRLAAARDYKDRAKSDERDRRVFEEAYQKMIKGRR